MDPDVGLLVSPDKILNAVLEAFGLSREEVEAYSVVNAAGTKLSYSLANNYLATELHFDLPELRAKYITPAEQTGVLLRGFTREIEQLYA